MEQITLKAIDLSVNQETLWLLFRIIEFITVFFDRSRAPNV
jgi:hypothetical protein